MTENQIVLPNYLIIRILNILSKNILQEINQYLLIRKISSVCKKWKEEILVKILFNFNSEIQKLAEFQRFLALSERGLCINNKTINTKQLHFFTIENLLKKTKCHNFEQTKNLTLKFDFENVPKVLEISKYFKSIHTARVIAPITPQSAFMAINNTNLVELLHTGSFNNIKTLIFDQIHINENLDKLKSFQSLEMLQFERVVIKYDLLIEIIQQQSKITSLWLSSTPANETSKEVGSYDALFEWLKDNSTLKNLYLYNYYRKSNHSVLVNMLNNNTTLENLVASNLIADKSLPIIPIRNQTLQALYASDLTEYHCRSWQSLSNLTKITFSIFESEELELIQKYHYKSLESLIIEQVTNIDSFSSLLKSNQTITNLNIYKDFPNSNNEKKSYESAFIDALKENRVLKALSFGYSPSKNFFRDFFLLQHSTIITLTTPCNSFTETQYDIIQNQTLTQLNILYQKFQYYHDNVIVDTVLNILQNNRNIIIFKFISSPIETLSQENIDRFNSIIAERSNLHTVHFTKYFSPAETIMQKILNKYLID
ncbi:hypothetical protein DLAC_04292 [Tieghemostelium lacteum]|uniref:F-box domain-containing protein n=1 Tax=Tieghemostelium lacteum TaxID=361077 RepID=A0A151ZJE2_TIELA|nr:hypothetical protein DLAC_04292 [Tieghemostelium lacteum]|eukprot:KYQ94019.1 hypothetical protein DLAC_04292 [Tieghemostelium lacteum]